MESGVEVGGVAECNGSWSQDRSGVADLELDRNRGLESEEVRGWDPRWYWSPKNLNQRSRLYGCDITIDIDQWRWWLYLVQDGIGDVGFKLGDMKDWMHGPHGVGELEGLCQSMDVDPGWGVAGGFLSCSHRKWSLTTFLEFTSMKKMSSVYLKQCEVCWGITQYPSVSITNEGYYMGRMIGKPLILLT
jgi:hypothetical protein